MGRYRHEIDNVRAHVRSLQGVIGLLVLLVAGLWYRLESGPDAGSPIHLPPDLRAGATFAVERDPGRDPSMRSAYYIFQQLNRWSEDGAQDYGRAIFPGVGVSDPSVPGLAHRRHGAQGAAGGAQLPCSGDSGISRDGRYSEARVEVSWIGSTWIVWLDVDLVESMKGMTVKQTAIRYPLRVVRQAVDLEANPWGLALDHYGPAGPQRLSETDLNRPLRRIDSCPVRDQAQSAIDRETRPRLSYGWPP